MKKRPLILVAPTTQKKGAELSDLSISVSEAYLRAVILSGGTPAVLSCTPNPIYIVESVRLAAGVLLTGGEDIQPSLHTPDVTPALAQTVKAVEPERDLFELMLITEVFRQGKPLLAICRGHQMLNVAMGGTLLVDIPTQRPQALNHRQMDRKDEPVHEARLAEGSLVHRAFGRDSIQVNSTHHQSIDRLAKAFRTTATAPDGIIEAMELAPDEGLWLPWFLSVQFHPERLFQRHPGFGELFSAFVQACARPARRPRLHSKHHERQSLSN